MIQEKCVVGVCGAGAMGAGIAQVAAQAGHAVVVYDVAEAALERGRQLIDAGLASLARRGQLDTAGAEAVRGRIAFSHDLETLAPASLVIEAIIEDLDLKSDLFRRLEHVLDPGAIIASNTSSLSIGALAGRLQRPDRFAGMHFFNPPAVMRLVEVVAGPATSVETVDRVVDLATDWGKRPVRVRDAPGFIVNRVARPYYAEGLRAWGEGAAAASDIDAAFRAAGFRMGPLELADLIGHDVNFAVARSVYDAYFGRTRFRPEPAQAALASSGRLGRKTGRGVYDPAEAASRRHDPPPSPACEEAVALVEGLRRGQAIDRRGVRIAPADGRSAARCAAEGAAPYAVVDWSRQAGVLVFAASEESAATTVSALAEAAGCTPIRIGDRPGALVLRALGQVANAAADALRDKVASEAEIDEALIHGANYPQGPLAWARDYGVEKLVRSLDHIAEETGEEMYRPSEILRRAAWSGEAA